jgi:hypothetical protein
MEYGKFRCRHCGKRRRRRTREQSYCGERECQKARKNAWRRDRYATDADYRANQRDSTEAWLREQGGAAAYHRDYRRRRKEAEGVESRGTTPERDEPQANANSDASPAESSFKSGIYAICPITAESDANSDAIVARIELISRGWRPIANIDPVGGRPPAG